MKLIKTILTHLAFVFSTTLLVPLIIDMFFNEAMGFVRSPLYKWLLLFTLAFSAISAAISVYYKKKRK